MDPLYERGLQAFASALRCLDPIRFRIWSELGLTLPQARVLFILSEDDQTTGDLAARLDVSPPTMTGIADRLVRQGLIERVSDPADRRLVRLTLSEKGRRVTAEHSEGARVFMEGIFEAMPREQVTAMAEALESFVAAREQARQKQEVLR